jgi:hypothetical protein
MNAPRLARPQRGLRPQELRQTLPQQRPVPCPFPFRRKRTHSSLTLTKKTTYTRTHEAKTAVIQNHIEKPPTLKSKKPPMAAGPEMTAQHLRHHPGQAGFVLPPPQAPRCSRSASDAPADPVPPPGDHSIHLLQLIRNFARNPIPRILHHSHGRQSCAKFSSRRSLSHLEI